jgi:hypothetical protein
MQKSIYIAPSIKVIRIGVSLLTSASKENYTTGNNFDSREADDRFDWGASDDEEYTPSTPQTPW